MPTEASDAHVLVVEDNLHNYLLMTRLLSFLGIKHQEWKRSGQQVLETAESMSQVDLILMDIHLPYEDGYEALSKLRSSLHFADTLIDGFSRFYRGAQDTGMAYHIGVGKIRNYHIVIIRIESFQKNIANLISAHFWFEVVGSNFR